ncbi:hypothetical protein BTM398_06610 [Helicobacter pylori]
MKDLNAIKPMQLPREIDTDSFLNAFNGVENKENFIKHLKSKPDSKHRLAYLHLVEPTLKEPDITLIFKDKGNEVKKEHIKAFQGDPKTIYYFLVTQDNDSKLIAGLKVKPIYIFTLKQRLTRRTLSTLSFRRQERLKNKPMEWACI